MGPQVTVQYFESIWNFRAVLVTDIIIGDVIVKEIRLGNMSPEPTGGERNTYPKSAAPQSYKG